MLLPTELPEKQLCHRASNCDDSDSSPKTSLRDKSGVLCDVCKAQLNQRYGCDRGVQDDKARQGCRESSPRSTYVKCSTGLPIERTGLESFCCCFETWAIYSTPPV